MAWMMSHIEFFASELFCVSNSNPFFFSQRLLLLVCRPLGESGLGKSTLVNSLFLSDLYQEREYPDAAERVEQTG